MSDAFRGDYPPTYIGPPVFRVICRRRADLAVVCHYRWLADGWSDIGQYGSVKGQAELRMRKEGASSWRPVPLCTAFLDENFDTRFLTTLGLLLVTRSGNGCSRISTVNQLKKGGVLRPVLVEI